VRIRANERGPAVGSEIVPSRVGYDDLHTGHCTTHQEPAAVVSGT
jgi:hypothetical protein